MSKPINRVIRQSALAAALGVCFASPVYAQSNTSGNVFGTAASGSTVTVEDPTTGVRRQVVANADGSYRASALPPGTYNVTVQNADGTTSTRSDIIVQVGVGTPVNFVERAGTTTTTASGATSVGKVTVRGSRVISPIDVSSTESATILSSAQIARIPVARDTTSVALLAPGTVRGDGAFGNLASFGGASVAENQFYINGFNVTNSFQGLNFSSIPFEGISEQQIKTGGYGAEFGRSLGGVVNQITKRGTNDFKAGASVYYTPHTAREDDLYLRNGTLWENRSLDETETWNANIWAGGALVKDKLFAYGLIGYTKQDTEDFGNITLSSNSSFTSKKPNWLVKLDWNINDKNLLEFTAFSDNDKQDTAFYRNELGEYTRGDFIGTDHQEFGGKNYIAKYTGYFTDNFTLSALAGHGEFERSQRLVTADGTNIVYGGDLNAMPGGCPVIVDVRPQAYIDVKGTGGYSSQCNITGGAINRGNSKDERDQFRIDADWTVGNHDIRFGIDIDNYKSIAGTATEGGRVWRYSMVDPDQSFNPRRTANPFLSGDEFEIVREQVVAQGASVQVKQRAFYVQDNWHVTDNFIAYIGLRWDSFKNLNGDGEAYVNIKNQFGPRLGFSWDVMGDSTFKVYGNAGRYALPLTPSVAVRGASASLFTRQNFNYTGVDPVTGAPIGLTPRGPLSYINGEAGDSKNPLTIASTNLKPMFQDEFILGFQKQLNRNLSIGAKAVYRNLKQAIDDNCDYTAVLESLGDNDHDLVNDATGEEYVLPNGGFPYCRMFNPGEDAVFVTDPTGTGELITTTVPGDRLSPKAKRFYQSLELFADGGGDNYSWHASYTWSKSKGNTEGGVKSDIGQSDTNVTQDFDYKELTVDTFGYLPNDRRHTLKAFGSYDFTPEWTMGANLLYQSGRPYNCFGVLEVDRDQFNNPIFHPYGASFMRCGGEPVPRGTAGRLPNTTQLDLNVAYKPAWAPGLQFKIDVFNVLNSQKATAYSEIGEDGVTGSALDTYLRPRTMQTPRGYRFMIQYTF